VKEDGEGGSRNEYQKALKGKRHWKFGSERGAAISAF
jgi:hypothetical protein